MSSTARAAGVHVSPPGGKPDANVLARFLRQPELYVVLFGFLLNFWWEVSQIPFYTGINRGNPYFGENTVAMKSFFVTTFWRAAFLDALLVLGGCLLMTQIYQNRYWFVHSEKGKPAWLGYLVVTAICVTFLVYLEVSAFDKGLWGYSEIMPTLFRKIGVVPVAALCWTPTIILLLARRIVLGFDLRRPPARRRGAERGRRRQTDRPLPPEVEGHDDRPRAVQPPDALQAGRPLLQHGVRLLGGELHGVADLRRERHHATTARPTVFFNFDRIGGVGGNDLDAPGLRRSRSSTRPRPPAS